MPRAVGLYGDKLGYDPVNDFEHVSQFAGTPIGIFVKKDFPANTLQELIARLKSDGTRSSPTGMAASARPRR